MTRSGILLVILLVAALLLQGCCGVSSLSPVRGSGEVTRRELAVGNFDRVVFATIGELVIELGNDESLVIEAEENLQRYFDAYVSGDALRIRTTKLVNLRPTQGVRFFLTVKNLEGIEITGSGDAIVPDIETRSFEIKLTGSGDLEMGNLDSRNLDVSLSGSGDASLGRVRTDDIVLGSTGSGSISLDSIQANQLNVTLYGSGSSDIDEGSVERQTVRIMGSGDHDARNVDCDESDVTLSGSGSAVLTASSYLKAHLSGSGGLRYAGNPEISQSVTGSGRITSLRD